MEAGPLEFERKSDLPANAVDIRRNCRHIHVLGRERDGEHIGDEQ